MIYTVVVVSPSHAKQLASALANTPPTPRTVWVVGASEGDTLAAALSGEDIMVVGDFTAGMAIRAAYSERIGTEWIGDVQARSINGGPSYEHLIAVAKHRVEILQKENPSPLARCVA